MKTKTTYITAGETIDTIVYDDQAVLYIHYKHGYASFFLDLGSLLRFLDGDVDARVLCLEDDGDAVDSALRTFHED